MKLLLVFLLGMVVLGLVSDRFDRRTYALVAGCATFTTALFFTFDRFWS
jgi:MFS family permease